MSAPRPTARAREGARPWDVAVVVPARDEVELLPRCLASVVTAVDRVDTTGRVHILVVADRCVDGALGVWPHDPTRGCGLQLVARSARSVACPSDPHERLDHDVLLDVPQHTPQRRVVPQQVVDLVAEEHVVA